MFQKVVMSLFVGICSVAVHAASRQNGAYAEPTSWVPYPWATELKFTMNSMQGVWKVGNDSNSSLFYVRTSKDPGSQSNFLAIVERSAVTCATLSTGFGKEVQVARAVPGTRVVAEMRDIRGKRYKMMLRQFNQSQLPSGQSLAAIRGKVTVLTIMFNGVNKSYNYPMSKLSDRVEFQCSPIKDNQ